MVDETDDGYLKRLQFLVREKQEILGGIVGEMCDLANKPFNSLTDQRQSRLSQKYIAAEDALRYVQEKLYQAWSSKDGGDPYYWEKLALEGIKGWLEDRTVEDAEIVGLPSDFTFSFAQKALFLKALLDGADPQIGLHVIRLSGNGSSVVFDTDTLATLSQARLRISSGSGYEEFALIEQYWVADDDQEEVHFQIVPRLELGFQVLVVETASIWTSILPQDEQ